MKIWISSESEAEVGDSLWKNYMQIEKELNAYLKNIGYENVLEE